MIGGRGKQAYCVRMIGAAAMAAVVSSPALAADLPSGAAPAAPAQGAAIDGSALPTALAASSGPAPLGGFPLGAWMVYPSIFIGASYNDNVYMTPNGGAAAVGARLTPNVEADLNEGLYKTTLYANADAQLYPGSNSQLGETASTVSARAGFAEIWTPTSDIVTHFSLDYTREDNAFGSPLATGSAIGAATSFVGAPLALTITPYRQFTDMTTGAVSIEKTLTSQTFVRVGVGGQQLLYEPAPNGVFAGLNGVDASAFVRGGYWLTPQVNGFVEVGGDLRRYYASSYYDTNAYRVIGGLSSDLIGLFRGEAYAGVQQQFSARGVFGALTAPTYGGRVTYYPTQYLTVAASVDDSFGTAAGFGTLPTVSATNQTLQARLQADYKMFEYWTASLRGGYADTWYSGSSAYAATWIAGAGASYGFWRNYALTFDYQYTRAVSNGFGALAYTDNLATIGVTYHY